MGSNENASGGLVYAVKRILRHENFEPSTIDWDYALVELEQSIRFSEAVKPIRLIGIQQSVQDHMIALVTGTHLHGFLLVIEPFSTVLTALFLIGWGSTLSSESNRILHGAEIPIINQQACANAYRRAGTITPRMMCAGLLDQGGKDSCQGSIFLVKVFCEI